MLPKQQESKKKKKKEQREENLSLLSDAHWGPMCAGIFVPLLHGALAASSEPILYNTRRGAPYSPRAASIHYPLPPLYCTSPIFI